LYLSEGAQRKFAGLLPLRNDSRIEGVTTLSRQEAGSRQVIPLAEGVSLTVLPAYHDDIITGDSAVGLGFRFVCGGETVRTVVFTGDSGYYPRKLSPSGEPEHYDTDKTRPKVDCSEGRGLFEVYPEEFRHPDLLVAHIGSIQEEEFRPLNALNDNGMPRDEGEWYYPNHLGILGLFTLLDRSSPKAAVISEFGAELRDFNVELVLDLGKVLNQKQQRDGKSVQTYVLPGDVTMAYYVDAGCFFCHQDGQANPTAEMECRRECTFAVTGETREWATNINQTQDKKPHLFLLGSDQPARVNGLSEYYRSLYTRRLPHFRPGGGTAP